MHSGNAAAMPPARKDATLSFCQASRSVRITTAILVSNCMRFFQRHSGARATRTRNPEVIRARFRARCFASPRNDVFSVLPLGIAGPGADHAFLAAEVIAFLGCLVERGR